MNLLAPAAVSFPALGTTASVLVTEPSAAEEAERLLRAELAELDLACSRFRPDSEIHAVQRRAGRPVVVGPVLAAAIEAALRAAELTDGLVDPTVGTCLEALGYDRDHTALGPDTGKGRPGPAPGWWRLGWDPARREVVVPRRVRVDLGATAKALGADRAAGHLSRRLGCGVLVNLGGDLAVGGPAPVGGWRIAIGDDHRRGGSDDMVVSLTGGGLATSGTTVRRWPHRGAGGVVGPVHHLVDPRTGRPAAGGWRTVTVAAATCVDANTASTAAIVLGPDAPGWLAARGLPARLVGDDGEVRTVAGWPTEEDR